MEADGDLPAPLVPDRSPVAFAESVGDEGVLRRIETQAASQLRPDGLVEPQAGQDPHSDRDGGGSGHQHDPAVWFDLGQEPADRE